MLTSLREPLIGHQAPRDEALSRTSSGESVAALPAAPQHPVLSTDYFQSAFAGVEAAMLAGRSPIPAAQLPDAARKAGQNLKTLARVNALPGSSRTKERAAFLRGDLATFRRARAGRRACVAGTLVGVFCTADLALIPLLMAASRNAAHAAKHVSAQDLLDDQFGEAAKSLAGTLVGLTTHLKVARESGLITAQDTDRAVDFLQNEVYALQSHPSAQSKLGGESMYRAAKAVRKLAEANAAIG